MMWSVEKLLISAGEASGDRLGAELLEGLWQAGWSGETAGMAGVAMRAAGVRSVADQELVAVSGFGAFLPALPKLLRARHALRAELLREPESTCWIAIDAPDFHQALVAKARSRAVRVGWLAPPQAWAWRPHRATWLAEQKIPLATLFPFEEEWYRSRGCAVRWVGHPLVELTAGRRSHREPERLQQHLLLLPGSRSSQWPAQLKWQIDVWRALRAASPLESRWSRAVVVAAQPQQLAPLERLLRRLAPGEPVEAVCGMDSGLHGAAAALCTPGTITLELALSAIPFAVAMALDPLTYRIAQKSVLLPYYSLSNLLTGESWASEAIFSSAKPIAATELAAQAIGCWERQEPELLQMALRLEELLGGGGYRNRVAEWVKEVCDGLL